jgi:hypothetical protein
MADDSAKLIVPGGSWEMVKKIVLAYQAVDDQDSPSVETVAEIAGKARPLVSSCNSFLRSIGLLRLDENKLTPIGLELATGVSLENDSIVNDALQKVVRESPPLARLVAIIRARGSMKLEAFRGHVILVAGLSKDSRTLPYIRTILDLLEESGLLSIDDDTVSLRRLADGSRDNSEASRAERESNVSIEMEREDIPTAPKGYIPTPFPLGPNRLAYLSLPGDWNTKELPKLLKMIELAFGEESK